MMCRLMFTAVLLFMLGSVHAQAIMLGKGKIEYEKKVNMHKILEDNTWTRELKDQMPVYAVSYYQLCFDSLASTYRFLKHAEGNKWSAFWGGSTTEGRVLHTDLVQMQVTDYRQVFEKKYLIKDSSLAIEWRITDEHREIAGFDCRKAVGRLYDSLYVVAFYTDQILISGGPGYFSGLPGTIMGLALPRYYTTWFATKVVMDTPTQAELKVPAAKAAVVSRNGLMALLAKVFTYGSDEEKQKNIWTNLLE